MSSHTFIPTIALIGGIGSGKSAVANKLKTLRSVEVIDADQIGHRILDFPEVQQNIREQFGTAVFDEHGKVNRSVLAKIVFGEETQHQESLKKLEKIVHPEIHRVLEQEILSAKTTKNVDAILIDAAVILEAGWKELCDQIVFIECPFEQRLKRVTQNRGWSPAELEKRENQQLPLSEKRKLANYIIHNHDDNLEAAGQDLSQFIEVLHKRQKTNN
ncbi:dephospho-CoA kinase [Gimesia aquarii]|uniref:Dephospho-CoA kinase n=1 Tax=Gimesia aquarii TaxID=2527964 RepID=A0A517WYA6_9PLAN|nr:dephospho-CoA kinase [Gimesia aquarii]QDU10231.1 Dephospho-CoA kinase [Gimesia aquarii]